MHANDKGPLMTFERIVILLIFGAVVLGGIGLIAMMLWARQRLHELAIRERIAMIERGLVPSPEVDPAAFERLMGGRRPGNPAGARFQSAGVLIMGLGVGLAVLLSFAAREVSVGVGVGGALAIVGLAAFVNGTLMSSQPPVARPSRDA